MVGFFLRDIESVVENVSAHVIEKVRQLLEELTRPVFCTKWNVSVTPLLTFVRVRRWGCGDVGNAKRFPHLHALVAAAR